jgi:hypothetical protein
MSKLNKIKMKKAIFTFLVVLSSTLATMAQVEIKGGGGVNFMAIKPESTDYTIEGRIGYQFGAGVLIGEKFFVEPSVFWQRTSQYVTDKEDTENIQNLTDLSSIRVPVMLGYHIVGGKEEKAFALRIFAGPAGTFLTKVNSDLTDLTKDDFNKFLVDIDAGLGIDILFLFLDAHYSFGLSKVMEDGGDGKLRGFSANLGFRIPF